ncbi:MAG TPA: EamA family transporter RarD [Rectinemataceae bacterium]|nr:EamA family transporter RarD [Rectinemataceae bacterium]
MSRERATSESANAGMEASRAAALRAGTVAAFVTYAMWGLFPLYWKRLAAIDPFVILCHRIVWAALFSLILLAVQGRLATLFTLFKDRKRAITALASAILITINWGTYIWAVNAGHVTESSLGYYINPLLSVLLGALIFREKLDGWTSAAVLIAAGGIGAASVMLGGLPWISLVLASSFALYGAVKKKAALDPITGLAAETVIATPFAIAYLALQHRHGVAIFGAGDHLATALLVLAGVVTAVPLITFAFAANRIPLQRMGFIQYVSPTGQLALGLFVYAERMTEPLRVAFATVIAAVVLYAATRNRLRAVQAR